MEMETSTEPVDPLTPGAAALATQPEGECSVTMLTAGRTDQTRLGLRPKGGRKIREWL